MKKVALYVRVSTQEQKNHGLSVDSQIKALTDYAKDNHLHIFNIYNDAGISARKRYTKRPALLELINDVKNGKIDLILFTKLDRWFRSVADYYEVQSVLDEYKIPWRAIHEDYETETTNGIFKVNIMLSVAQQEADRTSDRIKSVMQYKREKGDYVGSAPTGYKLEKTKLIKDESISDAVATLFRIYLDTASVSKAMQEAKDKGLMIHRDVCLRMLRNPAYSGHTRQGIECEPYITDQEHQIILDRYSKYTRMPKVADRHYMFNSLCICGYCGRRMVAKAVYRKWNGGKWHLKYACDKTTGTKLEHPHLQMSEPMIESYLLNELDRIHLEQVEIIAKKNESLGYTNAEKEKAKLDAKLKRLAVLFEDGDLSVDDYRQKRDAIKDKMASLTISKIDEPMPLPDDWRAIYNELDAEHKAMFWHSIIKSITFTNETKSNPIIILN